MLNPLQVLPIIFGQTFSSQSLARVPEQFGESAVMDDEESVKQYDLALESKLAIVYAGALERIHQIRRVTSGGRAIDLCSGPGQFTLLLAKYFDFDEIIGVDLSAPMVAAANRNAQQWGLADRVRFEVGDATNYANNNSFFDVVTCNDAAHHMPDINVVSDLLQEMARLSSDNGVTLLTDLVRLKSKAITNRYTKLIGQDYIDRGLHRFQDDFCNSMLAAWTEKEIQQAVPRSGARLWEHKVQKLLPTVQFISSVPNDEQPLLIRSGLPWGDNNHPVPNSLRTDWSLFRKLI